MFMIRSKVVIFEWALSTQNSQAEKGWSSQKSGKVVK